MNSVLSQLRQAGYDIGLQGEEIVLEYVGEGHPDAAVVEPLLAEVAAQKADMIQCLSDAADGALLEMPLNQLAQSGICREVHSKVLDEHVIFAADNAEVPADTPLVVYRAAELQLLLGATPEKLQAVHQLKKAFDGEVVKE
jgi:hypothetical protein